MSEFGIPNNLKKYRRISGYSQKEVSILLGYSYTACISKWEKGFLLPSIENLFILSQLYNVLPHELYPLLWQSSKKTVTEKKTLLLTKTSIKSIEYFRL